MLIYNGPYFKDNLNLKQVKKYTKQRNAKAAMWTYDYDCEEQTSWYHLICDDPTLEAENNPRKKTRYYIRRSLKSCVVHEITCQDLLEHGYDVYVKASSRYRNFTPNSEGDFKQEISNACQERNGQPIGVFVNGKLIAYAMVYLKYKSLKIATAFFDPDYSKSYPMYGLYYYFQSYLKKENCVEVTNGARPLLHETNIEEFLLRLGWRKAYARLGLYVPKSVEILLSGVRFTWPLWKYIVPNKQLHLMRALLEAKKIAKMTRPGQNRSREK